MSALPAPADKYMARALELALRGEGRTAPNPPVGAVLVRDGLVVGEGFHPAAGEPHAEIFALRAAGELARGAELFVTLEPCCHQGRTGPCCEALIAAGVRRVCYGTVDPNPRVAGQGLARLQAAGVEVIPGPMVEACRRLIAPFAKLLLTGTPYLILKAAMTLDGQLATAGGESQWISCEASRMLGHQLRNRVDAILTGAGTVLADDPQLTVRLSDGRNPARVVLDSRLRTPLTARVFADVPGRRLLMTGDDVAGERLQPYVASGIEVIRIPRLGDHLDLSAAMHELGRRNLMCLLIEGGGALNGALLRAGLVDRLMLFIAPLLFGGGGGIPLFSGNGCRRLDEAIRLRDLQISRSGADLLVEGEVAACSPD